MKRLISIILPLLFLVIIDAHATVIQCVGMDSSGNTMNVIMDTSTDTLNVNGKLLKVTGVTEAKDGVTTEDFINSDGVKAYYSIATHKDKTTDLYLYNSATDDLIFQVHLACHK